MYVEVISVMSMQHTLPVTSHHLNSLMVTNGLDHTVYIYMYMYKYIYIYIYIYIYKYVNI